MREEITMTNNCLHDEVRVFAGVSVLRVSSALVYCVKVGKAKVDDAKVTTEYYSEVSFPPGILYRKLKEWWVNVNAYTVSTEM